MYYFIARQPIFDRALNVYGYELLYRQAGKASYDHLDGDQASARVITDGIFGIGLKTLATGKKAFINFTSNLLTEEVATLLPVETIAVEILEDVLPSHEIVEACKRLKEAGYSIVLDDFVLEKKLKPLIDLADIIKVDFLSTPPKLQKAYVRYFQQHKAKLLAEKVESQVVLRQAMDMGYSYFQGYFFGQPNLHAERIMSTYKINYLRLMKEITREDIELSPIEDIIKRDVALSYRLLKFINSAHFGFRVEIHSIRQALALMGMVELRKWLSLLAMSAVSRDKPGELMMHSLVRAKFCELLAPRADLGKRSAELFLLGLFSMIDAFLDRTKTEIFEELPLSDDIKAALQNGQGPFYPVFELVRSYERGSWEELSRLAHLLNLNETEIPQLYLDSIEWSSSTLDMIPATA
ncbi:MAG TPA: HDOD domain-containing protein [bacterium]|jgi:EAL and modified HD-GYP domain-containing signal transduction protein